MMFLTIGIPDVIAILVIILIITFAAFYIIKEKKKGNKCIGCPLSKTCNSNNKKQCSTNCNKEE